MIEDILTFCREYGTEILIALGILTIIVVVLLQYSKNRTEKKAQAPLLTPFGFKGKFNGFHFILKNDGPTRVREMDIPKYDNEKMGGYDITGEYLFNPGGQQGKFYFSKSTLAPGEQIMIRFIKQSDTRPYDYKGEWKVIVSYEGDFFKPKPLELIFEVDTKDRTISPINFK
jgi:hypothetical protein